MSGTDIVKLPGLTSSDESVRVDLSEDFENELQSRCDYVIVLKKDIKKTNYFEFVQKYVQYLQERGIEIELVFGNIPENVYLKLHISERFIRQLADAYEIDIENTGHYYFSVSSINLKISQTPVTLNQDLFRRQGEATNLERILILYRLLNDARFGDSRFDNYYGIQKLQSIGAVVDHFPLHDGECEYDEDSDFLNDRQILLKYWANFSMWYKEQPLNLIEKYYGTEVAFYFAWLGLYNFMLIPASAIGVFSFLMSVIYLVSSHDVRIEEICNSKIMMCPPCSQGHSCVLYPLKMECYYSRMTLLFDNFGNYLFAIFMSFWATAFLNMWKRNEKILKIRWNVEHVVSKSETRVLFNETSEYTPMKIKAAYYCLSYTMCLLLIGVVVLVVFGVIMYRISIAALIRVSQIQYITLHSLLIESVTTALLQLFFIKIYARFYTPMSVWLTQLENPRTQLEYDNSVIFKRYLLSFSNNYAAMFYLAFLKGRFYSPAHTIVASVRADLCLSVGCTMALCIQLVVIMLIKSLLGNILTLFIPMISQRFKKKEKKQEQTVSPQWEREFLLYPTGRYLLTSEFMDMIIQYGFVTFFVAVFPLAPLCALINNCLQLRLDAYELVTRYRRPIPRRNPGIGLWNNIIESITHLSIITNAFVLAFTSDFVAREIFKYRHNSLKGYIQSALSVYDMKDTLKLNDVKLRDNNSTICHYTALRYPPDHPRKYELTNEYWFQIGMRLLCVIVFEHVIFLTNGIFSYLVPDVSQKLKEGIKHEKTKPYELKKATMEKNATQRRFLGEKAKVVIRRNVS
ncbi:anoctamin-3-like [Zophobas morio]|uniref:anoctamin-3-like n=1 Tax=Zophobas morio TaxID=2755281 RepID=UPI0030835ED5